MFVFQLWFHLTLNSRFKKFDWYNIHYVYIQIRTVWNSNVYWPPIPWSVNPFLHYKSTIFGNVHLKGYSGVLCCEHWWKVDRFLDLLINSDFLLTTTSFIPSWIMMDEMGVSSHQGRYLGHFLVNISRDF